MTRQISTARSLADLTAAAVAEIEAGRTAIAAKASEIDTVRAAPIPLAEAEARVPAGVAEAARRWLQGYQRTVIARDIGHGYALGEAAEGGELRLPLEDRDGVPFGALAAGDPAAAARLLTGILRATYAEIPFTVPQKDRARRIQALEREHAELQEADERRTDAAIDAGLQVTHRPDVLKRRAEAAYEAKRSTLLEETRALRALA